MPDETQGSVTLWIGDLKDGGDAAAQPLWERYFDRLVHEARRRLGARPRAVADEEDAALSAFDSFCRGARLGRYPQVADRDDLWRLLVVITQRKAANQVRSEKARKRGGGRVADEADLPGGDERRGDVDREGMRLRFRGGPEVELEPSPEFAAELAEEYRRRLERLGDETLRRVALWKMEGYTDDEVAGRLGRTRRSVQRKLALIRHEWGDKMS